MCLGAARWVHSVGVRSSFLQFTHTVRVHGVTGGGVRLLPAPKLGLLLDQRRHATLRRQRPRQKRVHYPCHETMVRTRPLIFQQALQEHGAHNVACRKPPSGS